MSSGVFFNLIGKRFGDLIVVGMIPGSKSRKLRWVCKCNCGSKTDVLGNNLLRGSSRSCGCSRKLLPSEIMGRKYGRLLPTSYRSTVRNGKIYTCICDCGKEIDVLGGKLSSGNTKSCGCLRIETKSNFLHGHAAKGNVSREFLSWCEMKRRCYDKNRKCYKHYGARGISICGRWLESFSNFYQDMGECPAGMSIDRINNDGNYDPSNCRWATPSQQARNTRRTKLTIDNVREIKDRALNGEMHKDLAKKFGVSQSSIGNICCGISWRNVS